MHSHSFLKRTILLLFSLVLMSALTGCLTTRGVMYLGKDRVKKHLKDTADQKPSADKPAPAAKPATSAPAKKDGKKDTKKDAKAAKPKVNKNLQARIKTWERRRALMVSMPEGREKLGGYCTKPKVRTMLDKLEGMVGTCRQTLKKFEKQANDQGIVYWTFLGAGLAVAASSVIALALNKEDGTSTNVALGLGITGALLVSVVPIGGFDSRQERYKERARRLDNYMWSLRLRIGKEVCNATTVELAVKKLEPIMRRAKELCDGNNPDDGMYRLPE